MAKLYCKHSDGWGGIVANLELANAHDEVIIESGDYYGEETLKIPSNISLLGNSGTSLHSNASSIIEICGKNIHVESLNFFAAVTAPRSQCQIFIHDSFNISVKNLFLDGYLSAGIGLKVITSEGVLINKCSVCQFLSAGIFLCGSYGEISQNQCSKNQIGIVLSLSWSSEKIICTIYNNRCHNNNSNGIVIQSANVDLAANECWGNKGSGFVISTEDDQAENVGYSSIKNNISHSNGMYGIAVDTVDAKISNNECWGNKNCGIAIHNSLNYYSGLVGFSGNLLATFKLIVENNKSHDNYIHGIIIESAVVKLMNNECWDNKHNGIAVHTNYDISKLTANVIAENNLSHGNALDGFGINSAVAKLYNNECWNNDRCGFDFESFENDSLVVTNIIAVNNSSHSNGRHGALVSGANVDLVDNKFWNNKHSGLIINSEIGEIAGVTGNNNFSYNNGNYGIGVNEYFNKVELVNSKCRNNGIDFFPTAPTNKVNFNISGEKWVWNIDSEKILSQQLKGKLLKLWLLNKITSRPISLHTSPKIRLLAFWPFEYHIRSPESAENRSKYFSHQDRHLICVLKNHPMSLNFLILHSV